MNWKLFLCLEETIKQDFIKIHSLEFNAFLPIMLNVTKRISKGWDKISKEQYKKEKEDSVVDSFFGWGQRLFIACFMNIHKF
jgi:hypothetical protein